MQKLILDFLELVEQEFGGMRRHIYQDAIASGQQRSGQAFMNALRGTPYYAELSGSLRNTFYKNEASIYEAIDWLTTKR